ncbi:MAG: hypothetical protein Q8N56_03520 [bacterium]|nr:hypothetical protein [bacterium]
MLQYLVFVGAAASIFGTAAYIKDTLKGLTKPNRVTWLMWSVAPLIGAFAGFAKGAGWAALPVFMAGFCSLLILIASFANRNAYWKLEKFDYFCGFFSILALLLWGITKEPLVAIIFSIISDGFAAIPTLVKSWKHPETETLAPYVVGIFTSLTSFTAVKTWDFSSVAFPVYLVLMNNLLTFAILKGRFIKKNNL